MGERPERTLVSTDADAAAEVEAQVPTDRPVLLFDGVCNLCTGVVQWVIERDPEGQFRFASLQSDAGQARLERFALPTDDFDSFVLAAATADLADASLATPHADAVEFRMDLADDPLAALDDYDGTLPLIATNRVGWEGGEAPDTADRLDALETAAMNDHVHAVDVELGALDDEGHHDANRVLDVAAETGTATIVSTHDFEETPRRDQLAYHLERSCQLGNIGKLHITAKTPDDVLDLLRITRQFENNGKRVATMAMGEPGRHSRAVAPLYGSKIGYAPVDPDEATAPGQYDLETLRGLVADLQSQPS